MTETQSHPAARLSHALLAFAMTCAFGASVYSALAHRPMFLDGSFWYFNVLQGHQPFFDTAYLRLFGMVLHAPAVLLLKLFGGSATASAITALDLAYALHPWVSLLATYLILKRRGRTELCLFALLSFATATQSTIAFGVGVVPDALSVFWPLFALVITRQPTKLDLFFIFLLSTALCLTYEASILFFLFLAIVVFLERGKARSSRAALLLLFAVCVTWLSYRLLGPAAGTKQHFFFSIRRKLGLFRGLCLMSLSGLIAAYCLRSRKLLYATAVLVFLFAWFGVSARVFDLFVSFDARTTAIPIATLIAALAYFLRDKLDRLPRADLVAFVSVTLLVAVFHDLYNTRFWRKRIAPVYALTEAYDGCVYMPEAVPHLGNDWALPYLSTLLQKEAGVTSIVFARLEDAFADKGPCEHFMDGYIVDLHNRTQIEPAKHFDYVKALSGKIHAP